MDIDILLSPWNLSTIAMAKQINEHLLKHGKTWIDVEKYLGNKSVSQRRECTVVGAVNCPACKRTMGLHTVNDKPSNQVGGDYKSQWYCPHCSVSVFNTETYVRELERMGENSITIKYSKKEGYE